MLGDILRAEREKRGLTVKDIEQETSIRSIYIEAIENSNFKGLPGAVYARGFVRNYAQMLELDAEAIVQQFKEEYDAARQEADAAKKSENAIRAKKQTVRPVQNKKSLFSSGADFHERVEKSHRTQNIMVVAAVIVLAFVGAIFYFFGEDDAAKQTAAKETAKTTQVEQKAATAQPASQPTTATVPAQTPGQQGNKAAQQSKQNANTATMTNGGVKVAAQFSKSCWTQVNADGKTIFEGTIEAGQNYSWQGQKMVTVLAGNAGAVKIAYNGKDLGVLGKEGEVVEKRFTQDKAEDVK